MRALQLLTACLLFLQQAACLSNLEFCADSIQSTMGYFTFAGDDVDDYWANICANNLRVLSMGAAVKSYCTSREITPGWKILQGYCIENAFDLAEWDDISNNLSDTFIQSLHIVQFEDTTAGETWNDSVLISPELYQTAYRTTVVFLHEYDLHAYYGWAIYGFWGVVLLFGMCRKLSASIFSRKTSRPVAHEEAGNGARHSTSYNSPSKVSSWIQANLIVPATFGTHHQQPLWTCTIPTRLESTVVASFYILNLILCCVTYEAFWPNLYYTEAIQIWRYVSDRTGIVCYANLPWLWMFSGRNNIFIWLTGWNFGTFNVFHRHIARVATIQAIVHSIGYTAIEANYNELAAAWKEEYWYMGGMATIVMSLLLVFSTLWVRRKMYEVFLIIHIAFAVLIIVGLFYHTAIFDGEYDGYLWPLVAIWLFDRFARIARLIYCNVRVSFGSGQLHSETEVRYDKEAHLLVLRVTPPARHLQPAAGQHYYIYQPAGWKMWENHPFTLASWTSLRNNATSTKRNVLTSEKGLENIVIATPASQEGSSGTSSPMHTHSQHPHPSPHSITSANSLIFYIRPYDSWTRRLQNSCLKSPNTNHVITTKMSIEGPYGERAPLHTFHSLVFIIGGSGITAALPYLQEFIVDQQNSARTQSPTPAKMDSLTREVTFIWSTRQAAMVQTIVSQDLNPLLGMSNVNCHFHVTMHGLGIKPEVQKADLAANVAQPDYRIQYKTERPDIPAYIKDVVGGVAEAGPRLGGRMAVFACGPAGMADQARAAVAGVLKREGKGLEVKYFEESFGF